MNTTNEHQMLKLTLTPQALEALFPPGTEARVQLTTAVVAAFVRKNLNDRAFGDEVLAQLRRAREETMAAIKNAKEEMVKKVLADQGVTQNSWGQIELKNEAKAVISSATRTALHETINGAVSEKAAAAAEKLRGTIERDTKAAVDRMVDTEIAAAVRAKVQEVAQGVLGTK